MTLTITKALYGTKDVTNILSGKIKNDKLVISATNGTFGDPNPGVVKSLTINYEVDGHPLSTSAVEGAILTLPVTSGNKLGIFYTNNNIEPWVIETSLQTIKKAADKHNVDILTCVWEPIPNNPFHEIICPVRTGNHFNIAYQICQLLSTASLNSGKKYENVAFLEHDVAYGEDYFDYPEFTEDVLCNQNYIGVCKTGFQRKNQSDEPLHQLVMKFDYAVSHFKETLYNSIASGIMLEPPHTPPYGRRDTKQSSVHINHGKHFTSHFSIYSKTTTPENSYWGPFSNLYKGQ